MTILYLAFIALGLPDQLLGIAWPTMRIDFQKSLDSAGLYAFLVTIFTSISGYFNGNISTKYSVNKILIYSVLLTAIGILGHSISPNWLIFLLFAIPTGLGAGSVDSTLNNYVAMNFSSRHMSWLHAFWGIGSTLGPLIMILAFTLGLNWRGGYFIVSVLLFLLMTLFIFSSKIFEKTPAQIIKETSSKKIRIISINSFLSTSFFFIYTATEGGVGLWIYSVMTEARNFDTNLAGILVSIYWASLTIGRIIVGFITKKYTDKQIIFFGLLLSLFSMILLCFINQISTTIALITLGFGLSGIYPCMMNDTHKRHEIQKAQILMGHQVGAASLGFAFMIPLLGFVIQRIGLNFLPVILIFFVLYMISIELKLRRLINAD